MIKGILLVVTLGVIVGAGCVTLVATPEANLLALKEAVGSE